MLIMGWNVAGLSTTVQRIHESYPVGSNEEEGQKNRNMATRNGSSLLEYIRRHEADIVCLQEHKIPLSQLASRSEPLQCSSSMDGHYESMWSCCTDPSSKGMNGVMTYARKGLIRSADPSPLSSFFFDDDTTTTNTTTNSSSSSSSNNSINLMNQQGRCLMTDHGQFVLFNVYVPNGGSGGENSLQLKLCFLKALRRAMQRQRNVLGRKVILTGDLNLVHGPNDILWSDRLIHIPTILQQVQNNSNNNNTLDRWKVELEQHWDAIAAVLETKQAVARTTANVATGATFGKFRVSVQIGSNNYNVGSDNERSSKHTTTTNRVVWLGKFEDSAQGALHKYDFSAQTISTALDDDSANINKEESPAVNLIRKASMVSVQVLSELMSKIANVEWNLQTRQLIADSTDAGMNEDSPTLQWLTSVIQEDGMVDTFRHFYPNAKSRFTCWNQYTNQRFQNNGARIDFFLVDQDLMEYVEKGGPLRCCTASTDMDMIDPLSEEAALRAATANGAFQGASFQGGGIAPATQRALDTQFMGTPHTGIIYTPPSFSDHVAISLLLKNDIMCGPLALDGSDAQTRKAQPHKAQRSIAAFFGTKRKSSDTITSSLNASLEKKKKHCMPESERRQNAAKSFFTPRSSPHGNSNVNQYVSDGSVSYSSKQIMAQPPHITVEERKYKSDASAISSKKKTKGKKNSILQHFKK